MVRQSANANTGETLIDILYPMTPARDASRTKYKDDGSETISYVTAKLVGISHAADGRTVHLAGHEKATSREPTWGHFIRHGQTALKERAALSLCELIFGEHTDDQTRPPEIRLISPIWS
jgi:hypothetical protein